jgi:hypothetical protein
MSPSQKPFWLKRVGLYPRAQVVPVGSGQAGGQHDQGFVSVGIDHDTAELAINVILPLARGDGM